MSKIDIVITWVDGSDPNWLNEKKQYCFNSKDEIYRFRDMGLLKYWFRSIEVQAPWVNNIYFITWGHIPSWLNEENPKLKIIKHSDYIPKEYLPTFNSNVIELNLHRIPDLEEKFILFNDDFYLNSKVSKKDFFINNLPRYFGIYEPIKPISIYSHTLLNNSIIVNKIFHNKKNYKKHIFKIFNYRYGKYLLSNIYSLLYKPILGHYNSHVSQPYLKSSLKKLWEDEFDILNQTCLTKFRNLNNINHYLISSIAVEKGNFFPQSLNIGKAFSINDYRKILTELKRDKYKIICINDGEDVDNFDYVLNEIENEFKNKYPNKSSFEK